MKKSILFAVILLFSGIMVLFFACSKSSYNNSSGGGGTPSDNTIYMKGSSFSLPSLTISTGTKITWVNDDNMIHTVTADNGSFNSGDMNPGDHFSYTFNAVGTYNYHCVHHIDMTAVVIAVTR